MRTIFVFNLYIPIPFLFGCIFVYPKICLVISNHLQWMQWKRDEDSGRKLKKKQSISSMAVWVCNASNRPKEKQDKQNKNEMGSHVVDLRIQEIWWMPWQEKKAHGTWTFYFFFFFFFEKKENNKRTYKMRTNAKRVT